ncbi:hypothetical protein [Streptomyces prunicolor]|uniref:hypothetical protein n=1 Tax=Streptomyces prunicolor TaxID=67348 RepID=UPI000376C247|nr:hypothetical protein [Streptomyces prunicolor]
MHKRLLAATLAMLSLASVSLLAPAADASSSSDIQVDVGKEGVDRFSPEVVYGNPGDLVTFHFHGRYSATESTARLRDPCHPLGGFDTGLQYDGAVQSIVISTHNSIYVHSTTQCGKGMVAIINPGPNDSVETFRKAAIAQEG